MKTGSRPKQSLMSIRVPSAVLDARRRDYLRRSRNVRLRSSLLVLLASLPVLWFFYPYIPRELTSRLVMLPIVVLLVFPVFFHLYDARSVKRRLGKPGGRIVVYSDRIPVPGPIIFGKHVECFRFEYEDAIEFIHLYGRFKHIKLCVPGPRKRRNLLNILRQHLKEFDASIHADLVAPIAISTELKRSLSIVVATVGVVVGALGIWSKGAAPVLRTVFQAVALSTLLVGPGTFWVLRHRCRFNLRQHRTGTTLAYATIGNMTTLAIALLTMMAISIWKNGVSLITSLPEPIR